MWQQLCTPLCVVSCPDVNAHQRAHIDRAGHETALCGQVVKALDCGVRGHRFASHQLHLGKVFLQVSGFPSQESLHISLMARWLYPYTNHSVCIVCKTCIEKKKKKKKDHCVWACKVRPYNLATNSNTALCQCLQLCCLSLWIWYAIV